MFKRQYIFAKIAESNQFKQEIEREPDQVLACHNLRQCVRLGILVSTLGK